PSAHEERRFSNQLFLRPQSLSSPYFRTRFKLEITNCDLKFSRRFSSRIAAGCMFEHRESSFFVPASADSGRTLLLSRQRNQTRDCQRIITLPYSQDFARKILSPWGLFEISRLANDFNGPKGEGAPTKL